MKQVKQNRRGWLNKLVSDKSDTSSARVINILGAVTGTVLMVYHGIWLDTLTYDVFGVYLAYCGGAYVMGKYVGRKYDEGDRYGNTDNDTERYQAYGDTGPGDDSRLPVGGQQDYRG